MTLLLFIVLIGLLLLVAKLAPEPIEKVVYVGEHLITYTTDELDAIVFPSGFTDFDFDSVTDKVMEWQHIGGVWKPVDFDDD